MKKRTMLGLMAGLPMTGVLSACGGGGDSTKIRLLNASPDYTLDLIRDADTKISDVAYGEVSSYKSVSSGSTTYGVAKTGSSTYVTKTTRSLSSGDHYTLIAYGWSGSLATALLSEEEDDADSGESYVKVLNLAVDSVSLDVFFLEDGEDLEDATAFTSALASGSSSSLNQITKGSYGLAVTAEDDKTKIYLQVDAADAGITFSSKKVYNLVLISCEGGVLVDAFLLQQQGDLTAIENTQARVRLLNFATGGITVKATVTDSEGTTTTVSSGSTAPSLSDYVQVLAGSVTVNVTVGGTAMSAQSVTLDVGTDTSFMITGTASAPVFTTISDDNRLPTTSSKYKMRLVHGSTSLSSNTLTLAVNLSNIASGISYEASSSYTSKAYADSQSITITNDQDSTTPITTASTYTDVDLEADYVYSVFVYDSATGTPTAVLQAERDDT